MSDEKSKLDTDYERGFEAGEKTRPDLAALRARFEYLRLGGSWDMLTTESRATYIAGFEDAMKTLGVKP